ncbi:unnamed protein product [Notodromas monacha]|uniref:Uncharacterized protein n=1 Tax=Notodromas monacha TaxID=399045 RepID=A0A7R9BEW2_9CRUS|nr:unnamed protein product [Notodromas monacha]CAG0913386.1 unnamed protein product [Notodromas monacha]
MLPTFDKSPLVKSGREPAVVSLNDLVTPATSKEFDGAEGGTNIRQITDGWNACRNFIYNAAFEGDVVGKPDFISPDDSRNPRTPYLALRQELAHLDLEIASLHTRLKHCSREASILRRQVGTTLKSPIIRLENLGLQLSAITHNLKRSIVDLTARLSERIRRKMSPQLWMYSSHVDDEFASRVDIVAPKCVTPGPRTCVRLNTDSN